MHTYKLNNLLWTKGPPCGLLEKSVYLWYIVDMDTEEKKPMLRASDETRQQLKIIAALTHETMQAVLARLVRTELEQVTQTRSNKDVGSEEEETYYVRTQPRYHHPPQS